MAKVAGDILYHTGQIVTVEADTGGVTKGDMVYVSGESAKSGIYVKVAPLSGVADFPCGMALEDIAAGELGPILISSPVVFLMGTSTVTVGGPVAYGGASVVTDLDTAAGTIALRGVVGIAWKGVATDAVIPVQLMPCIFARYAS